MLQRKPRIRSIKNLARRKLRLKQPLIRRRLKQRQLPIRKLKMKRKKLKNSKKLSKMQEMILSILRISRLV